MHYRNNARWLLWFAPFRALSISSAYLVPFFQAHDLNSTEFFLVQTVFSLTVVLWEIPSGWIADRFGRALCIKLSAPIAAASMIAYGLSSHWWQFLVCEVVLGIANGLISGADSSLLYDSLHADGLNARFEKTTKFINALGFVAPVIGAPVGWWLASHYGFGATVVCDGVVAAIGIPFTLLLVESPRNKKLPPPKLRTIWSSVVTVATHFELRWLMVLTVALGTATYIGAWLSAQSYQQLGIPATWFALALAVRQLWKTGWSTFYHPQNRLHKHMAAYITLVVAGFVGMASGSWWLAPLMLGLDVVHAMQGPRILAKLNSLMPSVRRATLNSVVNMAQRLSMAIVGLIAGALADVSLDLSLLVVGALCTTCAVIALGRLAAATPHKV